MPRLVDPQKIGRKNNEYKNKTVSCENNYQIKIADILSTKNRIQKIDKICGTV